MKTVAFVGLILNTVGTALIWKFGLPADVDRHGHNHIVAFGENEEEKKMAKRYDVFSNIGMGCILLGFILQAVAIYCV